MEKLRLLIADDDEYDRLVLRETCINLNYFELKDAADGLETVEITESWRPHIILMDIMMPKMDGIEASQIIKERYPQIIIMIVTGVFDSSVEDKMRAIGIDVYVHKPINKELIRFELQNVVLAFHLGLSNFKEKTKKIILNPFNSDIPSYKTIFDIVNTDTMMEFGLWLFDRYKSKFTTLSSKFDKVIKLFYKLMIEGTRNGKTLTIIVEESYEEFYITIKFDKAITLEQKTLDMLSEFGTDVIILENIFCARLSKPKEEEEIVVQEIPTQVQIKNAPVEDMQSQHKTQSVKEVRVMKENEKELMHQSFIHKTSASDYVAEVGDILDDILELSSIDDEWREGLNLIEVEPSEKNLIHFVDAVLYVYVRVINSLFEFTALAYALTSLGSFIKDNAKIVSEDKSKIKTMIMLFEHLGEDLTSWREHIFVLQDTEDIHYLDSSFFSSCMQIEGIIGDKEVRGDDEDSMEFF
ncbi:MAG: response regulator [Sulfurimonas sp.]|nr:response regulator [Sulfurimonas sp.]MDD3835584.1 response regulator [Sulfurimonas sp.]